MNNVIRYKLGVGEKNLFWKGDGVGKDGLHSWLYRNFGSASSYDCELCGKKAYDWSSKTHEYKRDRQEFWTLCRKCHLEYDYKMGLRKRKYSDGLSKSQRFRNKKKALIPKFCWLCGKKNQTSISFDRFGDKYVCRRCKMTSDGRILNLKNQNRKEAEHD